MDDEPPPATPAPPPPAPELIPIPSNLAPFVKLAAESRRLRERSEREERATAAIATVCDQFRVHLVPIFQVSGNATPSHQIHVRSLD